MKPTCTSRLPCATSASIMFRQASGVVARGFSQNTGLPATIEATTYSSWVGPQEQTMTASTLSSAIRSAPDRCTVASGRRAATSLATSSLASVTATTSAPDTTSVSRRMWSCPIMPVPITPTRNVMVSPSGRCGCPWISSFGVGSVRPATHRTQPTSDVVAGGPCHDGHRDVRLDGVQVLLDDREDLPVQLAECLEQRRHVGLAVRRLAHNAELDGLGERDLLGEHPRADDRVDRLEVDVGDALGELLDDLDVVAVAVGDVSRVQAEVHQLRVGVAEEPRDPLLGVDVGVRVRVEDQLDAVLLEEEPSQLVGAGDQVLPLLGIDVRTLRGLAGVLVGVLLGQVDEVLRAHRGKQLRLLPELQLGLLQRVRAFVQTREDGASADSEAASRELLVQLVRILRHEPLRSQLGVHVPDLRDLVEVHLPGDLVRVFREPHPPRVGGGAESEP